MNRDSQLSCDVCLEDGEADPAPATHFGALGAAFFGKSCGRPVRARYTAVLRVCRRHYEELFAGEIDDEDDT